ncbi:MAG: hypothetical protein WBF88_16410 [Pusillimonas sp.]
MTSLADMVKRFKSSNKDAAGGYHEIADRAHAGRESTHQQDDETRDEGKLQELFKRLGQPQQREPLLEQTLPLPTYESTQAEQISSLFQRLRQP